MVRPTLALLAVLVLLPLPAAHADKAEVLARIDELMEAGELDEAKRMIDFFLGKNPGDAELSAKLDAWRIRKGDLGPLFDEEGLEKPGNEAQLRQVLLRVVRATYRGNPEEWDALPHAVSGETLVDLLRPPAEKGTAEEQRKATVLMGPAPKPFVPTEAQMIAAVKKGPGECLEALRWAEKLEVKALRPYAEKTFPAADEPELKTAAAALLLRLGDDAPRKPLEEWLGSGTPPQALQALKVLLRNPGKGKSPRRGLFRLIERSEIEGRVKPTLFAEAIRAIGDAKEPGAREFLEEKLREAPFAVDAARALGSLGDRASVPALLAFLKSPPKAEDTTEGGGLGFLGGSGDQALAAASESVRPALVGALALLRITRSHEAK